MGIRLLEAGYEVDVVARDWPDDPKTIEFTSPWAGAHHVAYGTGADMRLHELERTTFAAMSDMMRQDPSVPLHFAPQVEYREQPRPTGKDDELSQLGLISRYYPDFRWLEPHELPAGVSYGAAFTHILIETPAYLPYLLRRFKSLGGRTHRCNSLNSLSDALDIHPSLTRAKVVVNCTGLGARTLVPDSAVYATRGQLVIVRAPWVTRGLMRSGPAREGKPATYTYIIPRVESGTVVLGGCAEKNNWDPKPRPELAQDIKTRCLALCPELLPPHKRNGTTDDLTVLENAVGLRPTRHGGIRLELDSLPSRQGGRLPVVHNYGHGGYGYQTSWGSANMAVELVRQALSGKSKL
ncbi:D-amino-acid oxidase [Rhodotorula toruloides]|uniref:D-amino-acid oxidase n=1 Tax=Rhodotorula toruloides TaxID=5286 RepID=A0A511KMH2_RHOTO|nr:D-amino-acid oxidase [Rhodotorula toruloides]